MRLHPFVLVLVMWVIPFPLGESHAETVHHELSVTLIPSAAKLVGRDVVALGEAAGNKVRFGIGRRTKVTGVEVDGAPASFAREDGDLLVDLDPGKTSSSVVIDYLGVFEDPVPHMPLSMDNPGFGVAGVISQDGVFLQAGAGWYPEMAGVRATYRLTVDAPEGILAVSAGRSLGHVSAGGRTVSTWEISRPVEGLSLSAGRYVLSERSVGDVNVATYFLPENVPLSEGYLEAVAGYLELYEGLFGPYPFEKFAVVENFFPTGYGFPSYTLLGGAVIRLPFILQTSLGHEIAHCWWGNGVLVDPSEGNWSEGLTTYVADYLYKERDSAEAARTYRLEILRNYASLVPPGKGFPLSRFRSRYDPVSKVIGYEKGAMVFHMLRERIGEEAFWSALRDLYREKCFQAVTWSEIRKAFERRGVLSLKRFFEEWVFRAGAPVLRLENPRRTRTAEGWDVRAILEQDQPVFHLRIPVVLETADGESLLTTEELSGPDVSLFLESSGPPGRLAVDPDYHLFRRLPLFEVPPTVNRLKAAEAPLVILPEKAPAAVAKLAVKLSVALGFEQYELKTEADLSHSAMFGRDFLYIGLPGRRDALAGLPPQVSVRAGGFKLNGRDYTHPEDAFFGVFNNPADPAKVVAVLLPNSLRAAEGALRKITHYGKYSYLAFSGGRNRDKGTWPVRERQLVYRWDNGD